MAAPLSPTPSAALNFSSFSTPSNNLRQQTYAPQQPVGDYTENISNGDGDSSPFLSHIKDEITSPTQRGPSPPKPRPGSRIITGHELSPLKILQQQQQNQIQAQTMNQSPPAASDETSSPAKTMPPPPLPQTQSPRKMTGPIKRFPVKVSQPGSAASESPRRSLEERRPSPDQQISPRGSLQESEGLRTAIQIFEDEVSEMHDDAEDGEHNDDHTLMMENGGADQDVQMMDEESEFVDDTMMSNYSSFSAIPSMTILAQMRGDSPTRVSAAGGTTPRATPRGRNGSHDSGNGTSLQDYTEQMRYSNYGAQPTPSRRGGSLFNNGAATPQQPNGTSNLTTILDYDIPPMPTPRSVPTITPRELESLKSRFLSEISSLKASLSGKEAEAMSLKTAVGDAEKRVGECMEQLREVQGTHESLTAEKNSWEQRGREMEVVLRKVREEIVTSQREREELEFKLDEADKRREAAEMMAQDAESKMAGMRAGKASAEAAAATAAAAAAEGKAPVFMSPNKEVEQTVERLARDLHALYKNKHETKITALKNSYEKRWQKRLNAQQARIEDLIRENEQLRADSGSRDAAFLSRVDPARLAQLEEERRVERARDAAHVRELEATVEKVEAVLKTVQADNADLRVLLERERVEKGELVQLAEEMMNMQQSFVAAPEQTVVHAPVPPPTPAPAPMQAPPTPSAGVAKTPSRRQSNSHMGGRTTPLTARQSMTMAPGEGNGNGNVPVNNFRMSTGPNSFRASGLRAPGGMMGLSKAGSESRIGRGMSVHERTKSAAVMGGGMGMGVNGGGSGMPRPGSGQGLRNGGGGWYGIVGSIEKMGGSYGHRV